MYRWLHKSWNFMWVFVGVLFATLILLCGAVVGLVQLKPVKQIIATNLEERFNQNFAGTLKIGEIGGFIPVNIRLDNVHIYADSTEQQPMLRAEELSLNLDVFSLIKNRIVIKAIKLREPHFSIGSQAGKALQQTFALQENARNGNGSLLANNIVINQLLMPSIVIENGELQISDVSEMFPGAGYDSLRIHNIAALLYLEITEEQRFIDISRFYFQLPDLGIHDGSLTGQIYNDSRFLELNAFRLAAGGSVLNVSGEADGVNLLLPDVASQLVNSVFSVKVDESPINTAHINTLIPEIPAFDDITYVSAQLSGTRDSLDIERIRLFMGDNYLDGYGWLTNLHNLPESEYEFHLEGASFPLALLEMLPAQLTETQLQALAESRMQGRMGGGGNHILGDLFIESERGHAAFSGQIAFDDNPLIDIEFRLDSLNITGLFEGEIRESMLNLEGSFKSNAFSFSESQGGLVLNGQKGKINQFVYDNISVLASWKDGFITPDIDIMVGETAINANGWLDVKDNQNEYSLNGSARNLRIQDWVQVKGMAPAVVDMQFDVHLIGNTPDEMHGQVSVDIPKAQVAGDTLGHHQLYFDFNPPESANRIFRFTSSAFDATLSGNVTPAKLAALSTHWLRYFEHRLQDELLGNTIENTRTSIISNSEITNLEFTARAKNTSLIHAYFPEFQDMSSNARLTATASFDAERMLFNASLQDSELRVSDRKIDSLVVQATGNFRYGQKLRDFSRLQLQVNAAAYDGSFFDARKIDMYAELNQDSIQFNNTIAELAGNPDFKISLAGSLGEESLRFGIEDFTFGSGEYTWRRHEDVSIEYFFNNRLRFSNFEFSNLDQYISIDGTFSNALSDSVNYQIGGVDLSRISRIIDGRIPFSGELNGVFTTKTLSTVPAIQGEITVDGFEIGTETVGDILLSSYYNSGQQRFDTQIKISTDPEKYPGYFQKTGRRGSDFDINGYVLAPINGELPATDSLFVFDIDFNNIDMWILPFIAPKIFVEGAGQAGGTGKIWGNLENYDFRADFDVGSADAAYLRPLFLETYYYAQGEITFTRSRGLEFNNIFLVDPSGGTAMLNGYYDFNDFQLVNDMNITLEMNQFQFLNSTFDPTAPFYGMAYGSSTVSISGTNLNPVLTTLTPMIISDFSEIGIPLLEETELNEGTRFIRFVDSFDELQQTGQLAEGQTGNETTNTGVNPDELSFAERFTLDLQFEANNPMTVQLIFDPVTGDVVTADGTGRLRLRLEDEQVSMFGRFNISSGRYQFVSGDIFSRRFDLESGGSITWEGDPANARLNLTAVYRARPDINTLTTARSEIAPENAQRVPVELVLRIGGTISSIDNEFFFRLPSTFESRQNSTLSAQIAALNRDEELKLIQSANFLLMGDFIPVSTTAGAFVLGDNISGSGAVLNPLLSSQVISPLLSSQINSLLNSDVNSLDIDFNLNTYNQVDLGVALRLYNDKLILRREGQITGSQSNIGDLGATYRINRTFAVTAFHRQDPTFGTIQSTEQAHQSQEINGIGIEANVSFNTWREFFNRLLNPFRKLFSRSEEETILTENHAGNYAAANKK